MIRPSGSALALLLLASSCGAALAASPLPIGGVYGNGAGCRFFLLGEASDDMVLLTPDSLATPTTGCDFNELVSRDGDGFTVSATCSEDGKSDARPDLVHVTPAGGDAYGVAIEGGEDWGPLTFCPGTDSLVRPAGVQI